MNDQSPIEMFPGNIKKAMTEAGASSGDLWKVPRDAIQIMPGFNVRNPEDDPDYVNELAELIRENGYQQDQPLAGYVVKEGDKNVIYLTDGHHRLAAIDKLIAEGVEFGKLPVVVKPGGTSMEDVTFSMFISNTGKPLTPYHVGLLCKRLIGYGVDEATIAQRFKFKTGKRYVEDLLSLVAAPKLVRDLVVSGKVSSTMAIQTLRDHGSDAQTILANAVSEANAAGKVKATAKHIRTPAGKSAKVAKAPSDSTRLAHLIECGASVRQSKLTEKTGFWLIYPNGREQTDVYPSANDAIDASIKEQVSEKQDTEKK